MKLACQIALCLVMVLGLLRMLKQDIEGTKARDPEGFRGAVVSVIATTLIFLLYWKAGALSLLIGE